MNKQLSRRPFLDAAVKTNRKCAPLFHWPGSRRKRFATDDAKASESASKHAPSSISQNPF